jgi:hypothetical protein
MGAFMCPSGFTVRFPSADSKFSLVIDDDGRVGYAYLLDADGRICGDVWLYNRCSAPVEAEWSEREKAPFANPESYVDPRGMYSLPTSADDFSVEWRDQGKGIFEARIYIHRTLAGKLVTGAKPGWSAFARRDGPLARVLSE